MRNRLLSPAPLLIAALLLSSCDSLPGALEPDLGADGSIPTGQARLVVRNTGSRTTAGYSGSRCASGVTAIRYQAVAIAPNGQHAVNTDPGCVNISVDFTTGGGWSTQVILSTGEQSTISVR